MNEKILAICDCVILASWMISLWADIRERKFLVKQIKHLEDRLIFLESILDQDPALVSRDGRFRIVGDTRWLDEN